MKKNYKIILFVVVFLIIGVASFGILNSDKKNKIDKILASESYSYLPKEAKNYIKEVYEETGEVILTEKNKEENVPYLNPKYVDYLSIDNKEKDEISLIPNAYVIDFSSGKEIKSSLLPSYYNISNVDGNNYTTPMKNQGNLDLCWAFASLEQAESYLMKSENKSYSESSKIFSTRQMDYATSINGISNYENENGSRLLTYGGNFNLSAFTMSNGLSLVNDSHMPYNYSKEQRELSDVLNYRNSNYEVNSTITMPQITDKTPNEDKENYNAVVKQNIIKYGGAYVSTASPNGKCGFKNKDNSYAMIDSDNCAGNFGHAMQIIGWDDDYEYNYCLSGSSHLSVGEDGNCESGKSISGKGAWILRNSWGDESVYKNVFLAYDSYGLDINFTTSLSDMNSRIWDNNYHNKYGINTLLNTKSSNSIFSKKINTEEKVEYIKFMSASINGEYSVSIDTQDNSYNDIKIVNTDYPGIYTVDLSEENILLTSDKFKINIQSENNTYVVNDSISVFTSYIDKTHNIYSETIDGIYLKLNNDSYYEFVVYSET